MQRWETCFQSCTQWGVPSSPRPAALRVAGDEQGGQKKRHLQLCSAPGNHLLPEASRPRGLGPPGPRLGGQHEETPEGGQGLWARKRAVAQLQSFSPPHQGTGLGRTPHGLPVRTKMLVAPSASRRGFAWKPEALEPSSFFRSVFSCSLCLNRDHLLRVSNR